MELYINEKFNSNLEAQDEAQDKNIETYDLTEIEIKILKILSEKPASKTEIAADLGYKSISGNIKRVFDKLLNKNLIQYTIPEKPKSKYQKYVITQKA